MELGQPAADRLRLGTIDRLVGQQIPDLVQPDTQAVAHVVARHGAEAGPGNRAIPLIDHRRVPRLDTPMKVKRRFIRHLRASAPRFTTYGRRRRKTSIALAHPETDHRWPLAATGAPGLSLARPDPVPQRGARSALGNAACSDWSSGRRSPRSARAPRPV